jgi:hypothetical protein
MIVVNNERYDNENNWQSNFVAMLPEIQQRFRLAFRHLDAEAREDAVGEGVVHSLLSYARLHERGEAESATASTLAWYAAKQVRSGRPAGNRMNGKEPLSRYAQIENGIQVEQRHGNWMDLLVEDKRASVPDQVAAKLDVGAWFATLNQRMRQIARDLAYGFSTSETAERHGVTPGRISQLRKTLEASWAAFQNDSVPPLAQQ